MKLNCFTPKHYLPVLMCSLFLFTAALRTSAQAVQKNWLQKDPFYDRVFIQNKGQYLSNKIMFGLENDDLNAFFSNDGFTLKEFILNPENEAEEKESEEKGKDKRFEHQKEEINISAQFLNCKTDLLLVGDEKTESTFGFRDPNSEKAKSINNIPAFKKLSYPDLYPGINMQFSFSENKYGLKYAYTVSPNADPSQIKIKFSNTDKIFIDKNGDLHLISGKGEIIDKAPTATCNGEKINISFLLNGKTLSFNIGNYDHSKTLVIDPFFVNPLFTAQDVAYDCTRDAAGNVYVFGGQNPWKLKKLNGITGATIWTFNTTYASWYGDLATDPAGNSFISEGCCGGGLMKISTNNAILWNQNYGVQEFWDLAFNCDFTNLYLAQGYSTAPFPYDGISNVNQATGAVTGGTVVIGSEPRGLAWGPSSDMYLLGCSSGSTPNQVVGITSGFANIFAVGSGYGLAYNGPVYANGSNPTSGQNAIAAGFNFLCTSDGATLYKRNLLTGAQLGTLAIPGGVAEGNSGVLIDACDNIYVGSQNNIYKYDANLNLISTSAATGGAVYCLYAGLNGEIIGCGNGFVGAFAMNYQRNPFTFTTTTTPASCTCNGTAAVNVTFVCNNMPLTYLWNTGATTSSINALCPGNYNCVIKTLGCLSDTAYVTVVGSSTGGYAVNDVQTDPLCNGGNNGSATATPGGGTGPYTYSWTTIPVQTNATATGLSAGTYTVVVTDATGCTGADTITITQPTIITVTTTSTQPACGSNNGSITATGAGGTGVLTYSWAPTAQTTATATGLNANSYTVFVTDANGCSISSIISLNSTNGPSVSINPITNITCNGGNNGSATANAIGGNGPYTYLWTPSAQTNATATGLSANTYSVVVTDANGCTATVTIVLIQPTPVSVTAVSNQDVSCFGGTNGSASSVAVGGNSPYTYSWSNSQLGPVASNLAAGIYTVYVVDGSGCAQQDTVLITQPTQIILTTTTVAPTCNNANGSATVTANGGTGPYTFLWNNAQATATATGLTAGNYSVTVTDANGCTDTISVALINSNAPTSQITAQTNVLCFGGNNGDATVTANGGNGPYTYSWTTIPSQATTTATGLTAGTYSVITTDAAGCSVTSVVIITQPTQIVLNISNGTGQICIGQNINLNSNVHGGNPPYTYVWNTGPTTPNINVSPIINTSYTVTVTDANGCTDTASCNIIVNPLPVAVITASDTVACGNLCVTFGPTTNTIGATYSWNFGDGGTSTLQNPVHCYTTPGIYTVSLTVTSAAGCSATFTNANYITIHPVPVAAFTANPMLVTLMDPKIIFTDQSTGATTWSWTFGDALNGSSTQQNPTYTYQDTGYHTVTLIVTNQYGCSDTATLIIHVTEEFTFYVPNSFTPNHAQGNNGIFIPKGVGIDENHYDLWIFDRWGNMIFHTSTWGVGWDGRANGGSAVAQEDVYVWLVELKVKTTQEDKTFIGHVSLIK